MAERTQQLGRYELIKRIAMGGMGAIYLARSRGAAGFEKTVIIKKILDHLAEEEEFVTKFLDEGRIVVNLSHGNIVPVFDMDAADGEYFIAMEYVPGRDLRDLLKRLGEREELLPVELAVYVAIEAAKGLDYAHRRTGPDGESLGIVHRDISPSNILISRDGEVKIIDFGIARAASRVSQTVSGRIQGKICYMSPEQASGKSVGPPSDVFSLGVVLYEMLTGERIFQGQSDLESLDLVRQCEFKPPSGLNPKVPPELDAILARALSEDLEVRYGSADDFQVDLLEWLYARGKATTGQQLAELSARLFPEGFEREALRRARDGSTGDQSAPGRALNLDDALNAELKKLGQLDTIDPLDAQTRTASLKNDRPAPELAADESGSKASSGLDKSAELNEKLDAPRGARRRVESDIYEGLAPKKPAPAERAQDEPGELELEDALAEEDARAQKSEREDEEQGFKRWLLIALLLGLIVGGALSIYVFVLSDDGASDRAAVAAESSEPKPRQAWVTVVPRDAQISVNEGDERAEGQVNIRVAPDEQVLVEASHPGCESLRRVLTWESAREGVLLELECDDSAIEQADISEDLGAKDAAASERIAAQGGPPDAGKSAGEASADEAPPAGSKREEQSPKYVETTFLSRPGGAKISLDGERAEGAQRLRVGQSVQLIAALDGYKSIQKNLKIDENFGGVYRLELEKAPMGCVLVRPNAGQQVEVRIDGESRGETTGARFDLPAGAHKVELIWGDGSSSSYDIDVAASAECTGPLGFAAERNN